MIDVDSLLHKQLFLPTTNSKKSFKLEINTKVLQLKNVCTTKDSKMLDSNNILDKILKYFRITLANETDLLISKSKINTIFK